MQSSRRDQFPTGSMYPEWSVHLDSSFDNFEEADCFRFVYFTFMLESENNQDASRFYHR